MVTNVEISEINTKPPFCYSRLSDEEKIILQDKIINNKILNKDKLINMEIINSIRSAFIKNKMIRNHHFLFKNIANITNDLVEGKLPTIKVLDEKFGDNVIYLIIKMASIIDKIEQNE